MASNSNSKLKSIALLVCDTPMPEVVAEHGEYPTIFYELMRKSLPDELGWEFTMDAYDVVRKMEYPSEEKIDEYDAFMYTGSGMFQLLCIMHHVIICILMAFLSCIRLRRPRMDS